MVTSDFWTIQKFWLKGCAFWNNKVLLEFMCNLMRKTFLYFEISFFEFIIFLLQKCILFFCKESLRSKQTCLSIRTDCSDHLIIGLHVILNNAECFVNSVVIVWTTPGQYWPCKSQYYKAVVPLYSTNSGTILFYDKRAVHCDSNHFVKQRSLAIHI